LGAKYKKYLALQFLVLRSEAPLRRVATGGFKNAIYPPTWDLLLDF